LPNAVMLNGDVFASKWSFSEWQS